jgi:hypothetical protein
MRGPAISDGGPFFIAEVPNASGNSLCLSISQRIKDCVSDANSTATERLPFLVGQEESMARALGRIDEQR